MNRQVFPPHALRNPASGDIFPLHKLTEIRPMSTVPIFAAVSSVFDHRFLGSLLLEIGPTHNGSIFRHPRQAQRRLQIEPVPYVPIYQRIYLCHRASKIEPLHNVPIFSLKNAANFC